MAHDAHHGHDAHHDDNGIHATYRDYIIGFLASVVLTAIPFWLIMTGAIADKSTAAIIITLFAAVQVVVHMVYFLHMSGKIENGLNLAAIIFTAVLVAIIMTGTLWVMFHLNANMMPAMPKADGMG
jgi:cytochrome o ubiquinol oxidase operon protein cyoD